MSSKTYPSVSFLGKETFTPLHFSDNSFSFKWEMVPGHVVMEHFHKDSDEFFEITKGELTFKVDGKKITAKAGETLKVPKGVRHELRNVTSSHVECTVSYTPPADQGKFFKVALFVLKDNPAIDAKAGLIFKTMYICRKMNYKDFSTIGHPVGAAIFNSIASITFFIGSLSGWGKLTEKYKAYCREELIPA